MLAWQPRQIAMPHRRTSPSVTSVSNRQYGQDSSIHRRSRSEKETWILSDSMTASLLRRYVPFGVHFVVGCRLKATWPIPKRQPTRSHLQRPRQSFHCIHRWQLPPLLNVPDGRVTHPRELPEPDEAKTRRLSGLKQARTQSSASHRC